MTLSGDDQTVKSVFVNNDNISISIIDKNGRIVSKSPKRIRYRVEKPRYLWSARFRSTKTVETRRYLPLNEWCSTDLNPGSYDVEVSLSKIGVVRVGQVVAESNVYNPPLKTRIPIEVLSDDDPAVRSEFEKLLETASTPVPGTSIETKKELARAIELIVYSQEPLALPAQFELLSGRVEMWSTTYVPAHAVDLVVYLINKNNVEVAKGFLTALDDLQSEKYSMEPISRQYLTSLVTWAIHEIHERGNPEVVEATQHIVQSLPKTTDPRISAK